MAILLRWEGGAVWARYGMGRWELMAEDLRLGLTSKLELAAHEKRGKEFAEALDPSIELPKGGSPAYSWWFAYVGIYVEGSNTLVYPRNYTS